MWQHVYLFLFIYFKVSDDRPEPGMPSVGTSSNYDNMMTELILTFWQHIKGRRIGIPINVCGIYMYIETFKSLSRSKCLGL